MFRKTAGLARPCGDTAFRYAAVQLAVLKKQALSSRSVLNFIARIELKFAAEI